MSLIFYLSIISSFNIVQGYRLDAQHLIKSFVTTDDKPTALVMPNLCWSQYEKAGLAKALFEEGVHVAGTLQPNTTEYRIHHILIVADLACSGIETFLTRVSDERFFHSPYRWLLLDLDTDAYEYGRLQKLEMPINSDVVIAKMRSKNEFQLTEVYKIADNSDIIFSPRGVWLEDYGQSYDTNNRQNVLIGRNKNNEIKKSAESNGRIVDFRSTKVLSVRRSNLRGAPLTMVNVIIDSNETRNHLDDRLQLQRDSVTKMSYMAVKICLEMLNATEKLLFTNTWGYKDKNGNWGDGIVGHLIKKEADLGTLSIFSLERTMVIDYIAMVGTTAIRFVFREPPLALLENIFLLPFTGAVWLAILICILACAIFLCITSKWEAGISEHQGPLQLDGSWTDVLILIIGAVLQQGCTLEPRYAAGRFVMLLLFISLTILFAAYCANIVVLLRAPSSSVRTVSDLLNSPLKLGALDIVYNYYYFKQMKEPIRKEIYEKKIASKGKKSNFYSMKEGVELIRKGLFAFHMELNPGYRLIQETYKEDEKCDLVEIDYFNENDPWIPGQKRSPYNNMFKINFIKIREAGIQSCIHHRLQVSKPKCSGNISTFSSVGITDMLPAIVATLYGMLLAVAVLFLEITYKRVTLIREKKKASRAECNVIELNN